jgi:hypothetical protein
MTEDCQIKSVGQPTKRVSSTDLVKGKTTKHYTRKEETMHLETNVRTRQSSIKHVEKSLFCRKKGPPFFFAFFLIQKQAGYFRNC